MFTQQNKLKITIIVKKEIAKFLIDNLKKIRNIKVKLKEVDKKYIAVEFVIEMVSLSKVELVKNKSYPSFYNKYLVHDGRIIYLANNIDDVYVTSSKDKIKLSYYIAKSYQTFDDSIKSITDLLEETAIIRDGGSTVYKYKKYDITVVRCNNLNGNKNIYIGDYSANFDDEVMCK